MKIDSRIINSNTNFANMNLTIMKKLILSILFFVFTGFVSQGQTGYAIKGKIKGWQDTVCYLGNYFGKYFPVKDTARIGKDGSFEFKNKEKLLDGIYIVILPNKTWIEILLDKNQTFSFETDSAKMVENIKFKNSPENEQFYKYLKFMVKQQTSVEPVRKRIIAIREDSTGKYDKVKDSVKIYQDRINAAETEIDKYKNDIIKNYPDQFLAAIFIAQKDPIIPDAPLLPGGQKDSLFPYQYYKNHFWDNIPPSDDRLLRTPIFHNKLKQFFDKVVVQDPDSIIKESDILINKTNGNKETFKYIVWYMTTTYETHTIMGFDAVFVNLVEKYYMTNQAYWVDTVTNQKIIHRALTIKPLLLGKMAPSIIMQDTLDKNVALYDVKSKYTVIVFWDPDCGHCQKVIPKLREEYEKKLKAKGVKVYAVDIEDNTEKWKKFIIDNKMDWINVHDKFQQYPLRQLYDIYSTPVIYLLDENKLIKAKRIDVEQLDGYIDFLERMKEIKKRK